MSAEVKCGACRWRGPLHEGGRCGACGALISAGSGRDSRSSVRLFADAVAGRIGDDPTADRVLRDVSAIYGCFAALTGAWALWEGRSSPAAAIRIATGVPFYLALAWYLPKTKSRALACWALVQPLLALLALASPARLDFGIELTKQKVYLLAAWNLVEIAIAAAPIRLTFAHHRRRGTHIDRKSVVMSAAALIGVVAVASIASSWAVRYAQPSSTIVAARQAIADLSLLLGFLVFVLPAISPPKPATEPREPTRARARPIPIFVPAIAAIAVVLGGVSMLRRPHREPQEEPQQRSVVVPIPEELRVETAAAEVSKVPASPPAALPDGAIFGGRPLDWWSRRLGDLRSSREPTAAALHELLLRRAAANGLVADPPDDAATLSAPVDLRRRVARRFGGRAIDPVPTSTAAIESAIAQARAELAEHFAKHATFQTSPSHPRVIFAPRSGDTAALRIQFAAGAYHDGDLAGLTRVAQYAMISASEHEPYDRFARDLDRASGSLEIETGISESAITLRASAPEFDELAVRLVRLCLAAQIDPGRMRDAKARAVGQRNEADLDELTTLFASTAFDASAFTNDPRGDPETMRSIGAGDVERHLDGPLSPANATVTVAGAFNAARLRAALASARGGRRIVFERPTRDPSGTHQVPAGLYLHMVAFPVSMRTRDEIAAAHLAAAIIEEHLFHRFRGLGVAYHVSAVSRHRPWMDFILVTIPFGLNPPGRVGEMIEEEMKQLAESACAEETLARNRRHVIEELSAIDRRPEMLVRALAAGTNPASTGPEVAAAVAEMSRERWMELVRPWLDPRQAIHLELAPELSAPVRSERRR